MAIEYEQAVKEGERKIRALLNNPNVLRALNKTLPNNGAPIDYEAWGAGCDRFFEANEKLLKEWAKGE